MYSQPDLTPEIAPLWNQVKQLHGSHEWPKRVKLFSRIIEIDPKFVPAYVERGLQLFEYGQPAQAVSDFQRALEIDPNYGLAYYGLSWAKGAKGDHQGALQDAQRGLDLDPKHAYMYYRRIGAAFTGLGEHQRALHVYNQMLTLVPEDEGTMLNRGILHTEMGNYDKALADFNRVLELDRDWDRALIQRARTYYQMGELDKARADLNRVLKVARSPQMRTQAEGLLRSLSSSRPTFNLGVILAIVMLLLLVLLIFVVLRVS